MTSDRLQPGYRGAPRRRILVVDDNADAAEALSFLLTQMGQDVHVARDGRAALEASRFFRPQLVLLDLGMPGFDGYGVVQRLRKEDGFDGMRIVAVTGSGEPEDRRRTRDAGFFDHLVKPVGMDALRSLLGRL